MQLLDLTIARHFVCLIVVIACPSVSCLYKRSHVDRLQMVATYVLMGAMASQMVWAVTLVVMERESVTKVAYTTIQAV